MADLLSASNAFRDEAKSKNKYITNEYGIDHPDAKSDGDELGRGETSTIGTTTDIAQRESSKKINSYNQSNEYGIDNL